MSNVGSETPNFAGFKFRDAAGANGGPDNRQLVRDYLAYYEGQEQVLRITPEGKDYTWAFVNYAITNTQSVTGNISMTMWVSGTGTGQVIWDASVSSGTKPQFITQTIQAGQWVTLTGTQRTWTPRSDSKIIALDVGGLVGRTIYITYVVITGVSPTLNGVVNENF